MNKYAEFSKQHEARAALQQRLVNHRGSHLNGCLRKRPFDTEELALASIERRGFDGYAYRCRHCYYWHCASRKK